MTLHWNFTKHNHKQTNVHFGLILGAVTGAVLGTVGAVVGSDRCEVVSDFQRDHIQQYNYETVSTF